jgi:TonB family protein
VLMLARKRYRRMEWGHRWPSRCAAFLFLLLSLVLGEVVLGQDLNRKVIARTAPSYPELAKRMHLSGKVKVEVVIAPEGSVKSAKLVGGSPVFEKSAIEAVKQWRFEAANKETKAVILLEFAEQ